MENIIRAQLQDTDPQDVYELILDKYRGPFLTPSDKSLIESFPNLESLSLTGCGLKSLDNFPALPNLLKLELCDNKLRGSLKPLSFLGSLTMLSLAGNQISSLIELSDISVLPNLATLDLYGCPVTGIEGYSEKVFNLFKNLQVLDGMDKEGEEVSVASEDDDEDDDDEDDEDDNLSDFIEEDEEPEKRRKDDDDCNKVQNDD